MSRRWPQARWPFLLGIGVCVVSLAGIGLAQQPALAPEPIPALQQPATPFKTPVDAIVEQAETGKDEFLSERYNEEIEVRLNQLKKILAHRPAVEARTLAPLIAPEFRGTPLVPARKMRLRDQPPAVELYEPQRTRSVTAEALPQELERWLAGLAEINQIELKTTAISIEETQPPQVELQIRYDLTGRTETGDTRQLSGSWMTRWRQHPSQGWLWVELAVDKGWESRTPRPLFTDVTRCAVGQNPAYQQLLIGVDWWSAHLDVASGITINGFNGVAVADIDGDGLDDIYVCQPDGLPNRLFRAIGDGTFTEISAQAGLDALDRASSAVFFDYDNDGDPDLLMTGHQLLLFENDGQGSFTFLDRKQIGLSTAVEESSSFYSACVTDYNRDGWLDFYVCSYAWQAGEGSFPQPAPYYDATNGPPNFLFRNNGDGTFTDVSRETGLDQNNNRFSFACAWGDYNRDGWPDLYVANDFGRNNLYRSNGNGKFADVAAAAGVEDIGHGMSAAWEDYDNDGWLDLYVGNMYSTAGLRLTAQSAFKSNSGAAVQKAYQRLAKGNTLFRNRGDGTFEDVSETTGVTLGRWAWASQFFDLDLDGREDIYVANGYITNESTHDL
ncbi:MAG: FG-GAP repeat domain-containing protein [Terriglobia bacterium]